MSSWLNHLLESLGKLKDSPKIWQFYAPLLLALAAWLSPGWYLVLPVVAYLALELLPVDKCPEAQRIHFLIGYTCVRGVHLWGFLIVPIALIIEAWYDPKYEGDKFFWGGATDFSSYCAGALIGLI